MKSRYPRGSSRTVRVAAGAGFVLLLGTSGFSCSAAREREPPLRRIRLPAGFTIDFYARDVPGARSLTQGPAGVVFVGSRTAGRVYALLDRDGDLKAEQVRIVAEGLDTPNGVAFRSGSLYVAEVSRILRYDGIEAWLSDPSHRLDRAVIRDDLPAERHHGWKFIAFGPDGLLYVPVGAPCNVCEREDPRFASILRMKPDGSDLEVFARGVRNTVGFDWHPRTAELWFTDNGRDMLGDDVPPDELNHALRKDMHFGFPYCHGGDIPDPRLGTRRRCNDFTPPAMKLGPHVAALGMRFYTGDSFPPAYRGQVFIAEHGSWNRSTPIGYRVTVVRPEGNRAARYETFAEGWLDGRRAWGRPVDVLPTAGGELLVSDDEAGAVYAIRYGEGDPPPPRR